MIHFIINPSSKSGQSHEQWNLLQQKLEEAGIPYDSYFTHNYEETQAYVSQLTSNLQETRHHLALLGGDGTFNEVVNGISDRAHTVLTYLPTGSGNDLARSLGISRNPMETVERLIGPFRPRSIDIGCIEGSDKEGKTFRRLFAISSGIGFDAAACVVTPHPKLKSFLNHIGLGRLTYVINALYCLLRRTKSSVEVTINDKFKVKRPDFLFCVSMIQNYEGGGFPFCPSSVNNDGYLDICLVDGIKKRHACYLLPLALFGRHVTSRFVRRYRGEKIQIHTSTPLYVHSDGEVLGECTDITVTLEGSIYIQ